MLGVQGSGKSTLLTSLAVEDLRAGRGLCILDPHGDYVTDVLDRVSEFGREEDVRFLDLQSLDTAFGLSFFACAKPNHPVKVAEAAESVTEAFKKVWGDMSSAPRMVDLLGNVSHTMVANPGSTLLDIEPLFTNAAFRKRFLQRVKNPVIRHFWEVEYASLSKAQQYQIYNPLTNKIRRLTRNPLLAEVLGQGKNTIDMRQMIDEQRVVLIRLDSSPGASDATNLLGVFLVQQILEAGYSRRDLPEHKRYPFMLYFDECHRFATPAFTLLIREGRKYGLALTAATQYHSSLPEDVALVFTGSSTVVCFNTAEEDAKKLQGRFRGTAIVEEPIFDPDPLTTILSKGHQDARLVPLAQSVSAHLATHQTKREQLYQRLKDRGRRAPLVASYMRKLRLRIDAWLYGFMRGDSPYKGWKEIADLAGEGWEDDADREEAIAFMVAVADLGKALRLSPLTQGKSSDRNRVIEAHTHLPVGQAYISYTNSAGITDEAIIQTIQTKPGTSFRPKPLGIPRATYDDPLQNSEPQDVLYFDEGEDHGPPDIWEPR